MTKTQIQNKLLHVTYLRGVMPHPIHFYKLVRQSEKNHTPSLNTVLSSNKTTILAEVEPK